MTDVKALRRAIVEALPGQTSNFGETPDLKHLYVPQAHIKALRPECHLVIGMRGVGKSVWAAMLGNTELRKKILGSSIPELDHAEVGIGFAETPCIDSYPDSATFKKLLDSGHSAYSVWQSVVARWQLGDQVPRSSWPETVNWIKADPENLTNSMQDASRRLADRKLAGLIVFDALDRLSYDWPGFNWKIMDEIVRDLLQVALWLKSYPRLSVKVFLREDQLKIGDQLIKYVTNFPDASKLLASHTDLVWAPNDLHGLLWQYLLNAPTTHGEHLREIYRQGTDSEPVETDGVWRLSKGFLRESYIQREVFELIAGDRMGKDKRRGAPYVWAVGHLADSNGKISPRSFLAAIRQAAKDTDERYPNYPLALHYESIKRSIEKASEIRIKEISEDYPWVHDCMMPLAGLNLPFGLQELLDLLRKNKGSVYSSRLPPRDISPILELKSIGIFTFNKNDFYDMPDLFRVGFGLGRKGGVKPKS